MGSRFAGEAWGRALRQPAPSRFDRSPRVVDKGGAAADQGFAAAKENEIRLGHGGAMPQRSKQAWVKTAHPGQVGGVHPVALAVVLVDQTKSAGVGDDHLVAEFGQKATHPGRMCPCLKNHAGGLLGAEAARKSGRGGAHSRLLQKFAVFGKNADLTVAVSEIQPHGQLAFLSSGNVVHGQPPSLGP